MYYTTDYDLSGVGAAGFGAYLASLWIYALIYWGFTTLCMWKVFAKAGKPGWASIIPIYRDIVWLQIAGYKGTLLLWNLLPFVGTIIYAVYLIMSYFKVAPKFGKDTGFGVGLWFLNPIFMAILAFDKSEYTE